MRYFLLIIIIGSCYAATAQSSFSIKANMNTGVGIQQGKLRNVYGIGGNFETTLKKLHPLKFTAGLDIGMNGIKAMPVTLSFNGSVTDTKIHYSSYAIQASAGLKYIVRENKRWAPYAAVSAGALDYYTQMSIEDPEDPDGCSPLETKPVSNSIILAGTAEAGLRIRIKQRSQGQGSFLEAGVGYLAGTKGKYLRLEKRGEHNHAKDDYLLKFQQNSTGQVHEHSIGTEYKTISSQVIFHLAVVLPVN